MPRYTDTHRLARELPDGRYEAIVTATGETVILDPPVDWQESYPCLWPDPPKFNAERVLQQRTERADAMAARYKRKFG